MQDRSVTRNFRLAATGDSSATQFLWERFFLRLVRLARAHNASLPGGVVEEEDIALSTLNSVCLGLQAGRFPRLENRHSLWRLMVAMVRRKSADKVAYATRGKRDTNRTLPLSNATGAAELASPAGPADDVDFQDHLEHLLEQLCHDDLKRVAILKLQGDKNEEIATQIGRSVATVERKLRTIRTIWEHLQ